MAASKNNQFWKLRSKHGRDTLFSSPELLWSAACEYFDWCDENPGIKRKLSRVERILANVLIFRRNVLILRLDCVASWGSQTRLKHKKR